MNIHEKYIKRCIELAKNGLGTTYPNPLVGSVIVHNDKIIGEGWHQFAGGPHAEVRAIDSVKDKNLLKSATLYVNLEPCSHFGKTPPCANLIVDHGIPKVIIGTVDTNAVVCGNGIQRLKNSGCEVLVGFLEKDCQELNKRFFTVHSKKRPFIILKWAETKNGLIDKKRSEGSSDGPNWISNKFSRQLVHKLRATEEAILVGTETAINDKPRLDIRSWSGINPLRILIDRKLRVPVSDPIFSRNQRTLVLTNIDTHPKNQGNIEYVKMDSAKDVVVEICEILNRRKVQSLIVEGGSRTIESFIAAGLWDEAHIYVGDVSFESGLKAPKLERVPIATHKIATDTLQIYRNKD